MMATLGAICALSLLVDAPLTIPPAPGAADVRDLTVDRFSAGVELVQFYYDSAVFDQTISSIGKLFKGVEDFEEGNVPPNTGIGMDDPLDADTDNFVFDPGDILASIRIQSNTNGTDLINDPGTSGPNPRGSTALVALGAGANGGIVADKCVAPSSAPNGADSIDIISLIDDMTAMSLRIADVSSVGADTVEVRVFNLDDDLLGTAVLPVLNQGGEYLAFICNDERIGRVNIWAPGAFPDILGGTDAIYELTPYISCPADVDGDGVVTIKDLLVVLANWGPCGPACFGDLNGDQTVNVLDLLLVLGDWGSC